ncbi:MAG: VOC family protein [Vibrio sp.]
MNTDVKTQLLPATLRAQLPEFWQKVETFAEVIGLKLNSLVADHVAIRINEQSVAEHTHQAWLAEGTQISDAMINGRPIIVIELDKAFEVSNQQIKLLELPYPSVKTYRNQGWEHVEFVVNSQAQTAEDFLADVKKAFPEIEARWDCLEYMGVKVKLSSPKGEGERLANPTVAFKSESGVCIKLHPHTLKDVILSEL